MSFLTPFISASPSPTRFIDARTGEELETGATIMFPASFDFEGKPLPREGYEVIQLTAGWFSGAARVKWIGGPCDGDRGWVPLTVRRFHPSFLFQKVAFFPS